MIARVKAERESGTEKVPGSAKRILITGCPLAGVTER